MIVSIPQHELSCLKVDTLAEAPHPALSGVARVLVHAGKLSGKAAEELVRSLPRTSAAASSRR